MRDSIFQYQAKAEPVLVPAAAETVTLDKWFQPIAQPQIVPRRVERGWICGPVAPGAPETVTVDRWWRPASTPIFLPRRIQPPTLFAPVAPVATTAAPSMDWLRETNQPVFLRKQPTRHERFEPLATTGESILVDKWVQPTSQPLRRLPVARRLTETFAPLTVPATETVTLDKWFQPASRPVPGRAPRQQPPAFVADVYSLTLPTPAPPAAGAVGGAYYARQVLMLLDFEEYLTQRSDLVLTTFRVDAQQVTHAGSTKAQTFAAGSIAASVVD